MNPQQLDVRMHLAATLGAALPVVQDELSQMFNTRLAQTFTEIGRGTLTPDTALAVLIELRAYRQLEARLAAKSRLEDPK